MKEIKLSDIKFVEDLDGKSIILNDNGLFKQSKLEDLKEYIFNKDNYLVKELEEKILLLENKINELNSKLEDSKKEEIPSEIDGDKNENPVDSEQIE